MKNRNPAAGAGAPGVKRAGGKPHGEQTFERRMALLSLLPGGHRDGLSAAVLAERLAGDYPCTKRTVERDLAAIHREPVWKQSGIEITWTPGPDPRTRLWAHKGPKRLTMLHAPSGEDAMLIGLMAQELLAFLPESALNVLASYQPLSEGVLQRPGHATHARYHHKVRSLPDGPLATAPAIDPAHLRTLNEALLRDEQVDMRYYAGARHAEHHYRLHPLGMVKKGLFFWLIAFKEEAGELVEPVRSFRIDRVRSVERRANEPVELGLPTLQQALDTGLLNFFPKDLVTLRLRSAPGKPGDELINNYRDTPLGADQRITPLAQGGYQLEAQVRHTQELVWMLQAQAHLLEVLEPPEVRAKLQRFVALAARRYSEHRLHPEAAG